MTDELTPSDVKEIRKKLGLSQFKFAIKMGCTLQSIHKWEVGKSRPHEMFQKKLKSLKKKVLGE